MNKQLDRTQKAVNTERRRFLDMIGKAGISPAILKSSTLAAGIMANRFAEAQSNNKKIIFVYLPDGAPNGTWLPSSVSSMNGCTQPYAPHASNIAFRECDITYGGGHGNTFKCMGSTTWNKSDARASSINMQMAKVIGATMPYSSYQLGVESNRGSASDAISRLDAANIVNEDSPAAAYKQLFEGAPPSSGGNVYAQQRSVLDINKKALDALKTKLGQEEKERLDTHYASLEKIESRIDALENSASTGGSCSGPALGNDSHFLATMKAQSDIAVGALKCGLTRVLSIQCSYHQAEWVGTGSGSDTTNWTNDHHGSCHGGPTSANVEMVRYLSKGVAYLIAQLKANNLLESTMVVQVTDMGNGQDHTAGDGPFLIATQMPGFKPGVGKNGSSENILADAVMGMGLSSHVGGAIADYGSGTGMF